MSLPSHHYNTHTATSYEEAFFYEPGAYMNHLVQLASHHLQLRPRRRLLDIGGGTGNFAAELVRGCDDLHVTIVEPFLEGGGMHPNVSFVRAKAEVFLDSNRGCCEWRGEFHQVLIKETIHHLEDAVRVGILRGLYRELTPIPGPDSNTGGNTGIDPPSILIITRPQIDIDYPLWEAARQVWKENQPSLDQIQWELIMAGFVDVECTLERYDSQISLRRWQDMVRNRFWSTFSNFTEEELQEGCRLLEEERPADADGVIHFEDRLLFITARKRFS